MKVTKDSLTLSAAGDEVLNYKRRDRSTQQLVDLTNKAVRLYVDGHPDMTLTATLAPGEPTRRVFKFTAVWTLAVGSRAPAFQVQEIDLATGAHRKPCLEGVLLIEDFSV